MPSIRTPNLFIVGAPKCGTTALSHYLASHPRIFMSEQSGVKEPEYFSSDFRVAETAISSKTDYLNLFASSQENTQYLGEASTSYLYSRVAVPRIMATSPDARLIAIIRNPIEIAQRLHNQHVKAATETIVDFERAWRLQARRLRGLNIPPHFRDPRPLLYGEMSKLSVHVDRLMQTVPKGQLHVIVYDDFAADPAATYRRLLQFLDIEDDRNVSFPILNASIRYRLPHLQQMLVQVRSLREALGIPGGWGIHSFINRYNEQIGLIHPLRHEFHLELKGYFREEVTRMSRIMDRDLMHWLD